MREAGFKWNTGKYPGEDQEPAHERVWGVLGAMQPLDRARTPTARPPG